MASGITGLPNQFNQDDIPIVLTNDIVHRLAESWRAFVEPYWPAPYPPALYRPVAVLLLALQWAVGDGAPVVFRLGSLLMYAGVTLLVWGLGRRLLGATGGFVAAALFAVHPVHVEAVALAVNQGELIVAAALVWATTRYLDARAGDAPLRTPTILALLAVFTAGVLAKESAVMLPGILILVELLFPTGRPLGARLAALRPMVLGMVLVTVLVAAVRNVVLGGDIRGTFTAESIAGQDLAGRALTMAGVFPEVVRLLVWPDHLRADYTPQQISAATAFGLPQTVGVVLVVGLALLAALMWRRQPVIAFALGWTAIGYFPISNVLIPSGIVLAERALFLPSVGAVLLGGWLAARYVEARQSRVLGIGLLGTVLALGLSRSLSRHTVWFDQPTIVYQTLVDAPRAYRGHRAMAKMLFRVGERRLAEQYYLEALRLFPPLEVTAWELADEYRLQGLCQPAVLWYTRALAREPNQPGARAGLLACLAWLGEFRTAREEAMVGIGYGARRELFTRWRQEFLAAEQRGTGPGVLRLSAPPPDPEERGATW